MPVQATRISPARIKPGSRRERIVERISECERVSVDELADWLGTSRETIRRDLSTLAEGGRIRKYHGGATLADIHREGSLADRMVEAVPEKRAIAAAAAALFPAGSTILLDVGSTTLAFAQALTGRDDLTVITNGLDIARLLVAGGVKVFVVGGEVKSETVEMVGTLTVDQIGLFYASDAVLTVAGINTRGAMDFQLDEAQIARAMIAQARSVTIIADGSKLGRDGLFQVCRLHEIDRLVVDRVPDAELGKALKAAAVQVVIADH
jgi:DeoR family glycerol-3-phosphate regulon repressor